jgi:hypothetical protein
VENCHASDYTGTRYGTLQWTGILQPEGELVFGGPDENLAGGRRRGQNLPGCDVSLTPATPGIAIQDAPSQADGFRRLKLRNTSKSAVSSLEIRWQVK